MKAFTLALAHLALVHAAALPQEAAAPMPAMAGMPGHGAAPGKKPGLGPFGMDLTFLQGFDLVKLGPFIARMQPYFKNVVESGTVANVAGAFIPTLKHVNSVVLEAKIRKGAKRVKTRFGPITLVGKGVSYISADIKASCLNFNIYQNLLVLT